MTDAADSLGLPLVVLVGSPFSYTQWVRMGPVLLIEANVDRVQQVCHEIARDQANVVVYQEVLTEEDGAALDWYVFNDSRFDGHRPLSLLQPSFPNLRLLATEQRCGRQLGQLLDQWRLSHDVGPSIQWHLQVRQGDPLAALRGLGAWLESLESVSLHLASEDALAYPELELWFRLHGFRAVKEAHATWLRDPIATLQFLNQQQKKQILYLENTLLELTDQRDYQTARAADLEEKLSMLNQEIDDLLAEILQGKSS